MQSKSFEFIDLNSVAYVRPIGYRLNFPLSVIVNKTGAIILSTSDSDETSSFYEIREIDIGETSMQRNDIDR